MTGIKINTLSGRYAPGLNQAIQNKNSVNPVLIKRKPTVGRKIRPLESARGAALLPILAIKETSRGKFPNPVFAKVVFVTRSPADDFWANTPRMDRFTKKMQIQKPAITISIGKAAKNSKVSTSCVSMTIC